MALGRKSSTESDVQTVTAADVQTVTPAAVATRPADSYRAYMIQRAERESIGGDSPEERRQAATEISASQIDRIFAGETEDDIWDADSGGAIQGRDIVGLEVEIHSMRLQLSDRFEGAPYYGNLTATVLGGPREILGRTNLKIGSDFVLQTGAELILAKVRAFEAKGLLPVKAVIAGTETSSGNTVLKLTRIPERTA